MWLNVAMLCLLLVTALYGAAVTFLYLRQENILFETVPIPEDRKQAFASFAWQVNHAGILLQGWLVSQQPQDSRPFLIYYGGNNSEVSEYFAERDKLSANGFLYMNYRGYGESEGRPSEPALFADALYIFDQLLAQTGLSADQIVLMGRSLGSGVACYVAKHRPVKAVILVTPYDSLVDVAQHNYSWAPVSWLVKHRFDSIDLAPSIHAPLFNLMASEDKLIPVAHSQRLAKAWAGSVTSVILKGATHSDINIHPEYFLRINQFLQIYS